MDRYDINERFAKMWRKSRNAAGKSQEFVAKSLGVNKKTVQNWEAGTSCPSQEKGFEWFQVLGIQPLPDHIQPDVDILNCAFLCGKDAVKHGLGAYTSMLGGDGHVD